MVCVLESCAPLLLSRCFWYLFNFVPFKHEFTSFCNFVWWCTTFFSKFIVSLIGMILASDYYCSGASAAFSVFLLAFWSIQQIVLSLFLRFIFPYWTIWPIWALRKVFLMINSSSWRSFWNPFPLKERSVKLKDKGPSPRLHSLYSNCCNYWMKVPLISKSGLLEFKNSRVLSMDHRYFLMK